MPSHRAADKRHASEIAPSPGGQGSTPAGRRKAITAKRRRMTLSTVAAVGGLMLLVGGVGAATASHLMRTGDHSTSRADTAGDSANTHLTDRSSSANRSSLTHRSSATRTGSDFVSRSGSRPHLDTDKTPTTARGSGGSSATADPSTAAMTSAATRAAALRSESLQTADTTAQNYAKTLQSDRWVLPTSGFHITEWFGEPGPYWATGYHTGIDFATAYGTPVVAVQDAKVFQTGWDGPYGNQIRLQFSNGDQVWYNHLSAIEVTKGETVRRGQRIGRVGETGNAYGYHLHFEYRLAKDLTLAVDPRPFFAKHGITLH